jgi:hypothetical protein
MTEAEIKQREAETKNALAVARKRFLTYQRLHKWGGRWITWEGALFFFVYGSIGILGTFIGIVLTLAVWLEVSHFFAIWIGLVVVVFLAQQWKNLWETSFSTLPPPRYYKLSREIITIYFTAFDDDARRENKILSFR